MKRPEHSPLPYAALTDKGLVRSQNEDFIGVSAFSQVSDLVPESLLCVLCDGVGGHLGGETASKLAVEEITSYIEASDGSSPVIQLTNAIQAASQSVRESGQSQIELRGMATTTACAWIIGKRLFIATVGDSRIYLIRRGKVHQISTDHTWVQDAIEAGEISREEGREHPNAHVIKRYLGSETPPDVDVRLRLNDNPEKNLQGMPLESGDVLFICSDGVSDLVQEAELISLLKSGNLESCLETIKELAYQRGANDNLSMIAVRIPKAPAPATRMIKFLRLLGFAILVLLAAFVGMYFGWLVLNSPR